MTTLCTNLGACSESELRPKKSVTDPKSNPNVDDFFGVEDEL